MYRASVSIGLCVVNIILYGGENKNNRLQYKRVGQFYIFLKRILEIY